MCLFGAFTNSSGSSPVLSYASVDSPEFCIASSVKVRKNFFLVNSAGRDSGIYKAGMPSGSNG